MGTEHVKSGPTQPALGPWHGRAITKPRRARGQVGDLGARVQQGCARGASLEDMAWRAASFVLNEPGSRHLTPPPSRTLFPVCPSRAGHGEREPATWGAEPPLLRTNLQARAARAPRSQSPRRGDGQHDTPLSAGPQHSERARGPPEPQRSSRGGRVGVAPPPPTEAALLSGRRPLAGWAALTSFPPDGLGGFPVGLRPRVREHVAARSSGGGAWAGHAAFHTPEDREPHVAVTVALGGIAGSGRARGVRRPSGVAGIGVRTLHGGRPSPTGRGGGDAPLTAAPLVPRSSSSSR